MLNECKFIGRLGADPEVRKTQAGKSIVNLRLAVSKKWRDQNGDKQERTTWVPIVIFNDGLCNVAEQYLRKGSQIYVSGEFSVRKWRDQSGQDRYSTECVLQGFDAKLVMLDGNSNGTSEQRQSEYTQTYAPSNSRTDGYGGGGAPGGGAMDDDTIPFEMPWR